MDRRKRLGIARAPLSSAAALWSRFARRQTAFSSVSSLVSLVLAVVFASDLLAGHENVQRLIVALWLLLYGIAAIVPLVCGRRYPRWAGIVVLCIGELWSVYFLVFSQHNHAEINALLELPMIALYVGWFYRSAIGRPFIIFSVTCAWASLIWNPGMGDGVISPLVTVTYAVLITVFCFEGARAVRRQTYIQSVLDPLTGALNRRGLLSLEGEVRRRARRAGDRTSVAIIDFDDFRMVNERGGHASGDAALQESARRWRALVGMRGVSVRRGGLVARLGGDEFALLFRVDADTAGEMLRRDRATAACPWSWGAATLDPDEDLMSAVARADAELYRAKQLR